MPRAIPLRGPVRGRTSAARALAAERRRPGGPPLGRRPKTSIRKLCACRLPRISADKSLFGTSRSRPNFDQQIGLEGRSWHGDFSAAPLGPVWGRIGSRSDGGRRPLEVALRVGRRRDE
ncbi:MAG: hypothetical protein E6I52_00190 [Chloroflexi bacterium]|nr:MAG: hypothetical protein E6I52_00190 [Chloroflexota bacterium]